MNNWKPLKAVNFIVVHCSATPEDMDIGADEIKRWHLQRGWLDIGYHYVIRRNGKVEKGRPTNVPGAHARGFNHLSLGICLVGGVESDKKTAEANFTQAQWESLELQLRELKRAYPEAEILGHRDLPRVQKQCPSFDVRSWWESRNAD